MVATKSAGRVVHLAAIVITGLAQPFLQRSVALSAAPFFTLTIVWKLQSVAKLRFQTKHVAEIFKNIQYFFIDFICGQVTSTKWTCTSGGSTSWPWSVDCWAWALDSVSLAPWSCATLFSVAVAALAARRSLTNDHGLSNKEMNIQFKFTTFNLI